MKISEGTQKKLLASRRLTFAFALGLASAAFTAPSGQSLFGTPGAPFRVVAFGSSSTEGIGATNPSLAYPAQLQRVLTNLVPDGRRVEVVNRGIGGEDADDMVKRIKRDVVARKPDVVIWQTGSNDPLRHVPIARFEQQTRAGIAEMRKAGIRVILMEPQWCPRLEGTGQSEAFIQAVRRVGRDTNVDVVRRSDMMHAWLRDGVLTRRQMLAADGLHMTDGGYDQLARSIAPRILKIEDGSVQKPTSADEPQRASAGGD